MFKRIFSAFIILLTFSACTNNAEPPPTTRQTPTPTETQLPPSSTPLPTAVSQAIPTRPSTTPTSILTNTPLPPTNTPYPPTKTRIPTATPDPNLTLITAAEGNFYSIDNVILSSRNQLAFIRDDVLLVETAPGSNIFQELGQVAVDAAWSPDGSQLAYVLANYDVQPSHFEQYLWTADTNTQTNLSELIPDYPNPPYMVLELYWSPDGSKILFWGFSDERHENLLVEPFTAVIAVVDLSQKTFTYNQVVPSLQKPVWLTNDNYILEHIKYETIYPGDAIGYSAYDYTGQELWTLEWDTFGLVGFAPDGSYMINAGRIDYTIESFRPSEVRPATIDKINPITGAAEVIWQTNPPVEESFFNLVYEPRISSDGQYITFNSYNYPYTTDAGTLYIIDQNGQELGVYPDSYAHTWRPDGGLVITEIQENNKSQLIYLHPDGTRELVYETPHPIVWGYTIIKGEFLSDENEGVWSSDGRTFVFATRNNGTKIERLHLWQPGQGPPIIIFTSRLNERINDFFWIPNTQTLYFYTIGAHPDPDKLWRYDLNNS